MNAVRSTISLTGRWQFALDPENAGIRERWFRKDLPETIKLPGTTDEARKGEFADELCIDRLSRIWRWIGPAWYRRKVTIPGTWKNKRIMLFLERTKDSQVWVDGKWMGSDDSLCTPHEFDLTRALTPGEHTITVLVDNAKLPPVGPCHQVDERTQTNWNGIVGKIELRATDRLWIDDLQVYPCLEDGSVRSTSAESHGAGCHENKPGSKAVRVTACIRNAVRFKGNVSVGISVEVMGRKSMKIPARRFKVSVKGRKTEVECLLSLPDNVPTWDEFSRSMIRLTIKIKASEKSGRYRDASSAVFGMREFGTERGQFVINGRPTLLRGKNDCAIFPLTGYAPMDKREWKRLLGISRNYGLNHYRFHSWCPPEAAFQAADELGIYFQVELPNKREITAPGNRDYKPPKEAYETLDELTGDGGVPETRTAYLTREGERILGAYGNHPSFVMMTLGNELGGDVEVMNEMCDHFRGLDGRHLYARGTGAFHWDIKYREGDEFWVTRATARGLEVRGASWESANHVDNKPPSTAHDYCAALQGTKVPVVGHEMAQYEVFPDFREKKKYKGVLKAKYLDVFRKRLEDAGMLDQAIDFLEASGRLSAICHREDVEAALRTQGFGGFQMLDLQDFTGQGVALVGMLNVFMQSKGLITPKEWREFCCETVPLLWMKKYTWTNDERFHGRIRVAHYGPAGLPGQRVAWEVSVPGARCQGSRVGREGGRIIARGATAKVDIATGNVSEVDMFSAGLRSIRKAQNLKITLKLPGTKYRNSYDIWVYPTKSGVESPRNVEIARSFGRSARVALSAGKRVLLIPRPGKVKLTVESSFQTSFWSPMFRKPGRKSPMGRETPGVQGILCDPDHPLFRDFPTEFHGNWQWWHLMKNCQPMILDGTPAGYRPLVQMVDGFDRNHKLGLICEAKVGKGRLLVCSVDLFGLQEHPEARQLLACLYRYVSSRDFKPKQELDVDVIREIV